MSSLIRPMALLLLLVIYVFRISLWPYLRYSFAMLQIRLFLDRGPHELFLMNLFIRLDIAYMNRGILNAKFAYL